MAKLLQIAQLGNPILRKKASFVKNIFNKEIQDLIDDLLETLNDNEGVGISAPQVYQSKQIVILASKPSKRYPHAPKMKPTVIINPKIIKFLGETVKDWEGCLSIPRIRALVPRNTKIQVEYQTRKGIKVLRVFKDFVARIFQHEYDHLQGIMILDRVETNKDIIAEKEYQKIISKGEKK